MGSNMYTRIRVGVPLPPLNAYSSRGPEVSPVLFLATLSVGPLTLTRFLFLSSSYHVCRYYTPRIYILSITYTNTNTHTHTHIM